MLIEIAVHTTDERCTKTAAAAEMAIRNSHFIIAGLLLNLR